MMQEHVLPDAHVQQQAPVECRWDFLGDAELRQCHELGRQRAVEVERGTDGPDGRKDEESVRPLGQHLLVGFFGKIVRRREEHPHEVVDHEHVSRGHEELAFPRDKLEARVDKRLEEPGQQVPQVGTEWLGQRVAP